MLPRQESSRFPYVWAWGQGDPTKRRSGVFDRCRKGERFRVLARCNPMNSILAEFEDGYRVVTSRNGLRSAP